jgi:hypothetical protein
MYAIGQDVDRKRFLRSRQVKKLQCEESGDSRNGGANNGAKKQTLLGRCCQRWDACVLSSGRWRLQEGTNGSASREEW